MVQLMWSLGAKFASPGMPQRHGQTQIRDIESQNALGVRNTSSKEHKAVGYLLQTSRMHRPRLCNPGWRGGPTATSPWQFQLVLLTNRWIVDSGDHRIYVFSPTTPTPTPNRASRSGSGLYPDSPGDSRSLLGKSLLFATSFCEMQSLNYKDV